MIDDISGFAAAVCGCELRTKTLTDLATSYQARLRNYLASKAPESGGEWGKWAPKGRMNDFLKFFNVLSH